jgi:predicted RNA binding protein YcfA (HicA-like mRNA interferase family)
MRRECKTTCSLTLPLYIEVTVPSQESDQSCIYYIYIYILAVIALIFFTYLPECQICKNCLFIQTNSFIIFTCQNPALLVLGIGQVGYLVQRLLNNTLVYVHVRTVGKHKLLNNKDYHTVRTVPKSNKKITEKGKIDTTNYNQSLH